MVNMNRFRKHKKAKETVEDSETSTPSLSSTASKKNKKEPEEPPKPEFDLANALPSNEDFRTSLIMPKLSARFSMLREQDDPTTKIGKASDDSVLFPKRESRLNLFGHNPNPLSDIAEVSSILSRPSLTSRADSFASGGDWCGTDDDRPYTGSIMSRPRPGESNNFFGGRQKVYRIPVAKDGSASGGSGMRGRAYYYYYDDDIGLSAYQKLRLKEKEEKLAEKADSLQDTTAADSEDASSGIFSTNRMTTSSTASGPSDHRTSTAASSIDEQPQFSSIASTNNSVAPTKPNQAPTAAERGPTKSRRLYGQGLTEAVQNQQSSTMSRLEGLGRQRAGTPEPPQPNRAYSRSATNLHERFQKFSPVHRSPGSRAASPPPSATSSEQQPIDADRKDAGSGSGIGSAATGHNFIPPLSPPYSENEDAATLAAALHPQDRGKATAMGLFNKPSTQYDEQQFTRRQLQMHEGRTSSGRPRGLSDASYRSRAESVSSRYSNDAQRTGDNSAAPSVRGSLSQRPSGTFFANSSGSEAGGDGEEDPSSRNVSSATSQALDSVHPAFRSRPESKELDESGPIRESRVSLPEVRYSDLRDLNATLELITIEENEAAEMPPTPIKEEASEKAPDSPTLGPSGLGLGGLIRTHLRRDSDKSSIYPPPSPGFSPKSGDRNSQFAPDDAAGDVDENVREVKDSDSAPQPNVHSMATNMPMRGRQILNQAAALGDRENESRVDPHTKEKGEHDNTTSQEELKFQHKRNASTETQKEREEFANELAERRKKVQEKLKTFAENESRSSSPVPGRQTPDYTQVKPGNAFAMLKSKSAKNFSAGRQEAAQQKGMKTLGLGNATMSASTPSLISDETWREDEEKTSHSTTSSHFAAARNFWARAAMRRGSRDDSRESSRSRGPSPHSQNSPPRDRSSSEISGRSKSRTRHREDLGKVEESVANRSSGDLQDYGPGSVPTSARPSVDGNDRNICERSASAASGGFSGNSRPMAPGHIDINPGHHIQATDPSMIGSPRPSPATPYSANTTPPLYELSPDPSQRAPGSSGLQKRVVDKSQISEPTFISSTSNVPTVGLPPGASLSNGMETPPIPPMNPRRRRPTATQTILGALKGEKHEAPPPMPPSNENEEHSTFSDDEKRPRMRHLLRKASSENSNLNAKAHQENNSSAVPHVSNRIPLDGGMF